MAIKAKLISVALNTVTGNQAITGAGFAPEVAFGMIMDLTGFSGASGHQFNLFAFKSTTKGITSSFSSEDGVSGIDTGCTNYFNNNPGFRIINQDAVTLVSGTFVSFDSDGVTINIATAPPTGYLLHLLCLQDDTGNAIQSAMSSFNVNTTVGDQDVTGLGFDNPDCVIFLQSFKRTPGGNGTGSSNLTIEGCIGFAAGGNQAAAYIFEGHGSNPTNTKRGFRSDRCFHQEGQTSTIMSVSYVQGITDGFRINVASASGTVYVIEYIALKGLAAKVLNVVSSTTTGTTGVTGAGFSPSAIIGITAGTPVETVQDNARWSIGLATGPTARVDSSLASLDNLMGPGVPTNVSEKLSNVSLLTDLVANHGSPTDLNRWDLASVDSDGFTYDHEVADGSAGKLAFLLLGAAAATNQTVQPTGIASAEAFGTVNVFTGASAQTIVLTGIPSAEAFGVPIVSQIKIIQPTGIKSSDNRIVEAIGTFDDTAFDPQFTQYKVELVNGPDPRSMFAAFGTSIFTFTPEVAPGDYLVKLSLSNAAGTVLANTQTFPLTVGNVGKPTIFVGGGGGPTIIQVTGISSAESFGNVSLNMQLLPTGIASSEAFGSPTMVTGGLAILPTSIPSAEAFGVPTIRTDILIFPVPIPSAEAFGVPQLVLEGDQVLTLVGIETAEQFGTVTISIPVAPPTWPAITDPDTVWTRIPPGREG